MSKTVEQIIHESYLESPLVNIIRESEFDYIFRKGLATKLDTTPSPDVAGSDAVAFAVYTSEEGWSKAINEDWWSKSFSSEYCEPLTTSQLYAKFREEHPQPAGASVDVNFDWNEYLNDFKRRQPDYTEMDLLCAGYQLAAFQAAQQPKGMNPFDYAKNIVKMEEEAEQGANRITVIREEKEEVKIDSPNVFQPRPAAMSAGTWRRASDTPDHPGTYHVKMRSMHDPHGEIFGDVKNFTLGKWEYEIDEDFEVVEWLDEK